MTSSCALTLLGVSKRFIREGAPEPVIADFTHAFPARSITVLFGPNGCGKTTLLRLIAQREHPDSGSIAIQSENGEPCSLSFAFQNYRDSLFSWLPNITNVFLRSWAKREMPAPHEKELVLGRLRELGIPPSGFPSNLSGGQQQMLSTLRAVFEKGAITLLDEPFSALDDFRRTDANIRVREWLQESGTTAVMVSHSVEEAVFLADTILVLSPRPASIRTAIEVKGPPERGIDWYGTSQFAEMCRLLRAVMTEKSGSQS